MEECSQLSLFELLKAEEPVADRLRWVDDETETEKLHRILYDCIEMCEKAGVKTGRITGIRVNDNLHYAWGRCFVRLPGRISRIEINRDLLGPSVPEISLRNTILHELCHTVKDGRGHRKGWKTAADMIFWSYGIRLTVTCTSEELSIKKASETKPIAPKYVYRCHNCGTELHYYRRGDFVKHPENYYCTKCGGDFVKVEG